MVWASSHLILTAKAAYRIGSPLARITCSTRSFITLNAVRNPTGASTRGLSPATAGRVGEPEDFVVGFA